MVIDDYAVRHLSNEEIQLVAHRWRKALNQHFLTNCLDVVFLFLEAGKLMRRPLRVEPRPNDVMGRANAFVSPDRETVFVRQQLINRAAVGNAEAIFDAVHELAHLVLHRPSAPLARMADGNKELEFLPPEQRAEHQANVFARAFLMTDDEVARYRTPEALSEFCYTPLKEAALRLKEWPSDCSSAKRRTIEARLLGYERDACRDCGNFTLRRCGTCLVCDTCGSTSGSS